MKLALNTPKQSLNKAYLKEKVSRVDIEIFKKNLIILLGKINEQESEEHHKYPVADFLKDTWYKDQYEINTKGRSDFVIHTGKTTKEPVGVILEVKRPSNKSEMISVDKPNGKAMHELILYYLRERIDHQNTAIKYLVATNIYEWVIIDEIWFDKNIYRNTKLRKQYEEDYKQNGHDTKFFYDSIAKPFLESLTEEIPCTHFDFRDYTKILTNTDLKDDAKLIALYKILSPAHLLKQAFANDSNSLDPKFYTELLHIIGLEEIKDGGKKLIKRKQKSDDASLLENTILKLDDKESLRNIANLSQYGSGHAEQLFNVALELCITWVNRVLFLKLLEAQLFKYHQGNKDYHFLDVDFIHDFDELNNLFFQVLAEKPALRKEQVKQKFAKIPYLNSSLFERTELERKTFDIGGLDNQLDLSMCAVTVLKTNDKRRAGTMRTLPYLFEFLNAYDFTSEGSEEIQEENKNLINASVLGLIFEKINGYKDGSFFTPGFITMYMCRETIRRAVVQKFNEAYTTDCETFEDLKNYIGRKYKPKEILEHNVVINSLKICDPAVGSGHFLVSALNELIAIKAELGILADKEGSLLSGYEVKIENDELIITYNNNTEIFAYTLSNHSADSKIQRVQKTLFHEKETLIESCLFGVDINPNSVKICRLRLWIELLKNAYYTEESKFSELETLPNIDINIKCGNSLISRFSLDADLGAALKKSKWNIDSYRLAVHTYHEAESKEQKREMEQLMEDIKGNFRTEISTNDPKIARKSKLGGELYNLMSQVQVFELSAAEKKERKKKQEKLEQEINKLVTEIEEIKSNKIYENAFEWRFEFPEILDNKGNFVGFDVVIGNPPYGVSFETSEKEFIRKEYKSYLYKYDSYVYFIERAYNVLNVKGYLSFITPELWLSLENCKPIREIVTRTNSLISINAFGEGVFKDAVVNTCAFLSQKDVCHESFTITYKNDCWNVLASEWINKSDYKIEYRLKPSQKKIIDKIINNSIYLSSIGEVVQGITPYDKYRGQSEEIIKNRSYHGSDKKDETYGKWLDGKDLNRYSINWGGEWLRYGDWLAAPREKRFFEGVRILFREVPGRGKRIQAHITSDIYYYGHSISPFKPFEDNTYDNNYILGVVNSKLCSWYGSMMLSNFGKNIFPKLNPQDIKSLPIPKKYNNDIILKVKEMIVAKKNGSPINFDSLDNQIDQLVYQIYDLTEEEIKIVEEN
jgi:adenine-specific DNA-methyltransferase